MVQVVGQDQRDPAKLVFAQRQASDWINNTPSPNPGGRITLTTALPVLTSTVSAATTVYYTPYLNQYAPISTDGKKFTFTDLGGELSQLTTDTTKSPAAVAASKNYDMFIWIDTGPTYRCTRGPAWTSDTARGTGAGTTELERVAGVWTNKQDITNGPLAHTGTYVGTIRSNGSSTVDYIFGALGANGTAASFGVWNMYNRVDVNTMVRDSTDSWTYALTTVRAANASNTRRVSFVTGMQEDTFVFDTIAYITSGAASSGVTGVGIDVTNAFSGIFNQGVVAATAPTFGKFVGSFLGFHFAQDCEAASAAASQTFYGDVGVPTLEQTGMAGQLRM